MRDTGAAAARQAAPRKRYFGSEKQGFKRLSP